MKHIRHKPPISYQELVLKH